MTKTLFVAVTAAVLLFQSGCKIVYDSEVDTSAIAEGPEGDEARNTARIEETFAPKLLPLIHSKAVPVDELRSLIATELDAAGEAHANRGAGAGAAWNFPISGEGVVIEAKLDTRARALLLDTDADGTADLTLQLGPVIRGTTLRDAAPFYQFDDFRDQIEFAKLSRTLNDRLVDLIVVPERALVGETVSFVGVTPIKKPNDKIVVTPIEVSFQE